MCRSFRRYLLGGQTVARARYSRPSHCRLLLRNCTRQPFGGVRALHLRRGCARLIPVTKMDLFPAGGEKTFWRVAIVGGDSGWVADFADSDAVPAAAGVTCGSSWERIFPAHAAAGRPARGQGSAADSGWICGT